jgi:hypothetical protein
MNKDDDRLRGDVTRSSELSEEDGARLEAYLALPQHRGERADFKPFRLLAVLLLVLSFLSLLSYGIGHMLTAP